MAQEEIAEAVAHALAEGKRTAEKLFGVEELADKRGNNASAGNAEYLEIKQKSILEEQ